MHCGWGWRDNNFTAASVICGHQMDEDNVSDFPADRILQNNDIGSCSDPCIDASATIVRTQKCFSKTLCTQYKVVKRSYLVIWHWAEWSRATAHGLLFKISPAFVLFLPTQSTHRYIHISIHKLRKLPRSQAQGADPPHLQANPLDAFQEGRPRLYFQNRTIPTF